MEFNENLKFYDRTDSDNSRLFVIVIGQLPSIESHCALLTKVGDESFKKPHLSYSVIIRNVILRKWNVKLELFYCIYKILVFILSSNHSFITYYISISLSGKRGKRGFRKWREFSIISFHQSTHSSPRWRLERTSWNWVNHTLESIQWVEENQRKGVIMNKVWYRHF